MDKDDVGSYLAIGAGMAIIGLGFLAGLKHVVPELFDIKD